MKQLNPYIEELTWEEVAPEVEEINPSLARVINNLSPDHQHVLYRVRYRYGDEPLLGGILHLPSQSGDLRSIYDIDLPQAFKDSLLYNLGGNPVSLILKNTFEMYLPLSDRIAPLYGLMWPGKLFGTFGILGDIQSYNPPFDWHMSAGARSVFMLPKISNRVNHQKLQRLFGFKDEAPQNMLDHWQIFKKICNHPLQGQPWEAEILYFSKEWVDASHDLAWASFKTYLFQEAWQTSAYWRNQFFGELLFSRVQSERGIRFSSSTVDTLKHLLAIGMGVYQGMFPVSDEGALPYERLQKAYVEVYQLPKQIPTIMAPKTFDLEDKTLKSVVYYSLNYPTAPAFSPKNQKNSSVISDLEELRITYQRYLQGLALCEVQLEPSKFAEVEKKVRFEYLHADATEQHVGIESAQKIPKMDSAFGPIPEYADNIEFPDNAPFFKGCVRIFLAQN